MKIPEHVFKRLKSRLWSQADAEDWISLSDQQKSLFYERWSTDVEVAGVLSHYMANSEIRVYLKDTLMKPYARDRTSDSAPALKLAGLTGNEAVIREYVKPHGRLLADRRVVCWGQARDWKSVLLSVYERSYRELGTPFAAVLFRTAGKFAQPGDRKLVEELAKRLGISSVVWAD